MRKKNLYLPVLWILCFCASFIPQPVFAIMSTKLYEQNDWNEKEVLSKKNGDYTFYAHPDKTGNVACLYSVKVAKKGTTQKLEFPSKINGKKIISIRADVVDSDQEFYRNIFGVYVEPAHEVDGSNEYIQKIPQLILPSEVEEIADSALSGLNGIKEIKLPDSLKSLEENAFYGCDALTKVIFPKNWKLDSKDAFSCCKKIQTIEFPGNESAFVTKNHLVYTKNLKSCVWVPSGLTKVSILDGSKEITVGSFNDSNVRNLSIPASVEKIGAQGFDGKYLNTIQVDSKNDTFAMDKTNLYNKKTKELVFVIVKDGKAEISEKVEKITNNAALVGNGKDTENRIKVNLPITVKELGKDWDDFAKSAVEFYFHWKETMPKFVDSNEEYFPTFTNLYVPKGYLSNYLACIKKDERKFYDFYEYIDGIEKKNKSYRYVLGEKEVEILSYIGTAKNIEIPSKIEGKQVTEIREAAFKNSKIISVKVPDSVTKIGNACFEDCKYLKQARLGKRVKNLSHYLFHRCSKLEKVSMNRKFAEIPISCFSGCTKLKSVGSLTITRGVDYHAFYNCKSLTSKITIEKTAKFISTEAFKNCKKAKIVSKNKKLKVKI